MRLQDEITLPRPELSESQRALLEKRLQGARTIAIQKKERPAIPRRAQRENAPLSCAQQRLWFLDQLEPGSSVYNVCQAVRMTGRLHTAALEQGLNEIIRRHEILRTNFVAVDGTPRQVLAENRTLKLSVIDLSQQASPGRETQLQHALREEAREVFDLSRDLLLRALLVRLEANDHVLMITMHHIVSDGWSLGVFFGELAAFYDSFCTGKPASLPELPVQFSDFAFWEPDYLKEAALKGSLSYWKGQLSGNPPVLALPADHPRPTVPTLRGASESIHLSPTLTEAIKNLGQQEGATLFMTLLAAFQTLLHRYTGQEEILIGTVVAGRNQPALERLIGFFVNTLVVPGDVKGNPTFRELLRRVRETALGAFAHQDVPFERLVEELQPERSLSRNPFFQTMFVLQSAPVPRTQWPGLDVQPLDVVTGTAKFDLTLAMAETPQGLRAALEYNTDLFERDTILRMLGHFQTLLGGIAANPDQTLWDLPLLTEKEQRQLLVEWNEPQPGERGAPAARLPLDGDATIARLFEAQVERTPDAVALVCGDERLTYREVNARANGLAAYLRETGAGPGVFVGLCLERSSGLLISLLAILKAGGAYLPIDLSYPQERLAFMLEDAQAPILLAQSKLIGRLPATSRAKVICVDDPTVTARCRGDAPNLPPLAGADDLCYVIYTSGTTGKPKGSLITHRNVVRLFAQTETWYGFNERDVWTLFHSYAFDFSVWEIWGALLFGGRLVVVPYLVSRSPEAFYELLAAERVTVLNQTPSAFRQLIQAEETAGHRDLALRYVIFGGEALEIQSLKPWFDRHGDRQPTLVNMYGITETTVHVTYRPLSRDDLRAGSVIGVPIPDLQLYVLDRRGHPVPAGVPGELYVGGAGLGRGYLNRPDLSAERFVPNGFGPASGARLYKTGDLARVLPGRDIEYLGRIDQQVKIRGFRIELGEIESVLCQHPAVREAVVAAREDAPGDKRLVAYLVPTWAQAPDLDTLREHLKRQLPDYMVPAAFVILEKFPLTPNGKVDRRALPVPDLARTQTKADFLAARDDIEARLAGIWEKVLGVRPIGVRDNFFELGGHSLMGVRLFAQIEKHFGKKLLIASLFQAPTVGQLAHLLRENKTLMTCSSLVAIQPAGTRPPIFFMHGAGGGNLWGYANLAPHLGADQPVYGLESRGMRGLEEFNRIEDMAAHYLKEIRTVQPRGPYYLGGYCFGGNVAYEAARQLHEQGEQVALLALMESAPVNTSYHRIPWWRPRFAFNFTANAICWFNDFLSLTPAERRSFLRRKFRVLGRRIRTRFGPGKADPSSVDLEEIIDTTQFPEIELKLWNVHVRAIRDYVPKPYAGRVTLFRTRTQPFLCSFDPLYGWGDLAAGGVEVVVIAGSHEKIFVEPHARTLAAKLRVCLNAAQSRTKP